jgi:hypothetical protein
MSDQTLGLTNSRRRYEKRTYTPLVVEMPGEGEATNALGLSALVRSLMISDDEFTALRRRLISDAGPLAAATAMQGISHAVSASAVLAAASQLAGISTADMRKVSDTLGAIRTETATALTSGLQALYARYAAGATPQPAKAERTIGMTSAAAAPATASAATSRRITEPARAEGHGVRNAPAPASNVALHTPASAVNAQVAALQVRSTVWRSAVEGGTSGRILMTVVGPELAVKAPDVLTWAKVHAANQLEDLITAARPYVVASTAGSSVVLDAIPNLWRLALLPQLFAEALTQRPLQPLGLLHLGRLEMTPLEIERGELTYSLPLAPSEKVTLAHREWSVREEQFTNFIEDQLENYSQTGVTQSTDLAMSSSSQTSHDNSLNMGQPLTSANAVALTAAVDTTKGGGSSVHDTATQEEDKSQSRMVSAIASSRTMKDHKVSFTVTTVAGMEDFTAHVIENKHDDKTMRIDYFKRVRKWRSDLYRYGVRLTYDVVLPDPGAHLRTRQREMQAIQDELATELRFYLVPSDIQLSNWEQLADQYGVRLAGPPDPVHQIETTYQVDFPAPDAATGLGYHRIISLSTTVPDGFQLQNLNVYAHVATWGVPDYGGFVNAYAGKSTNLANADASGYCKVSWDLDGSQVPDQGQLTVVLRMQVPESGLLKLTATVTPTEAAMEEWRLACWAAIRGAASASDALHRSYLRDRQAALQREVAADDAIRLRRLEREAVMRAVLAWLFPGFEDGSSVLSSLPSPGSLDPGTWQQVMQYGEYIKFVQTAIDWDNVVVFLYPYFWDTIGHEHEKLFLNHPDPIHREFLRAGAARVIIAIQPGFETEVVSLLDKGQLGALGDQSRFAQAIQDVLEANAAYAQSAQGETPDENPKEPGILIGSWTDYTPTSTLDIDATWRSVING